MERMDPFGPWFPAFLLFLTLGSAIAVALVFAAALGHISSAALVWGMLAGLGPAGVCFGRIMLDAGNEAFNRFRGWLATHRGRDPRAN